MDLSRGDSVTLSTFRGTAHLGSHADAPSHYEAAGATIDGLDLEVFLGRCQVLDLPTERGGLVGVERLRGKAITGPRVLIRTGSFPDYRRFTTDFAGLAPELVERLASEGVRLIGVDTPSVDPFDSKELAAHHAMGRCGVAILEGLVLAGVPEGEYELVALPLRLVGFDASPVRAVLRTIEA